MASSPLRSKSQYHTRSLSLPSQSHPLIPQFNEHLCRLKNSDDATSSSLPSISNRLSSLEDLYECVDDLLLQPHSQHTKWVDDALDGYLSVLDAFASTKDIFSQTKEQVKQLLSSIRRNRDESNFQGYLAYRKKAIKAIKKLLKDLKSIGNKNTVLKLDQDLETVAVVSMLKEAQEVTVSVLESILSCAAGTKAHSRSLVSKLLQKKTVTVSSDFEDIDVAVVSFKDTETLQKQLKMFNSSIENVEEVLERLIRRLIKTRVSLLNILNH